MPQLLQCYSSVHLSPSRSSPRYYQGSTGKRSHLKEITVMSVGEILLLLELCLKNTYFSFQGQFYQQVEDVAMSSPVSPIVGNLYMNYFEQKALSIASLPPRLWCQYVDDTFVIQKEENKQNFYNT